MRIVIVNEVHPFGSGETFLADELHALARVFDAIHLAPRLRLGPPHPVPDRVDVLDSLAVAASAAGPVTGALGRLRSDVLRRPVPIVPRPLRPVAALARRRAFLRELARVRSWAQRTLVPLCDAEPGMPTVLYAYWFDASFAALAHAARLVTGRRPVVVCRAHGSDLYNTLAAPGLDDRLRRALGMGHAFPVSTLGARRLTERFPDLADRIETARLGVADPGVQCAPSSDDVLRIVSCSALRPVKRVDRTIDALARFATRHPASPVEWTHFGDGPLRGELHVRAERLPPSIGVDWAGHVPRERVLDHYRRRPVDVFVSLSASEGVPVSIMEAASAGIPILATDVGGTSEIVSPTTGTLLGDRPDADAIADALTTYAGQAPDDARRKGARARYARDFRADVNFARFASRLAELAGRDAARHADFAP